MKQTLENLTKAFIGESMARNRYQFFAKVAKKEGYGQIAEALLLTADNEREHASWHFKLINALKSSAGGFDEIKVDATLPVAFGDTATNLRAAIRDEHYEQTTMYPEFADAAERDGLPEVAKRLRAIARAEAHHEERDKKMLAQIEAGAVFKKDTPVEWVCRECGYVHVGEAPPDKCPACDHDRAYYQLLHEEY
ncbi:MAG: rubrerythrin [Halobacteriota archaeon]